MFDFVITLHNLYERHVSLVCWLVPNDTANKTHQKRPYIKFKAFTMPARPCSLLRQKHILIYFTELGYFEPRFVMFSVTKDVFPDHF